MITPIDTNTNYFFKKNIYEKIKNPEEIQNISIFLKTKLVITDFYKLLTLKFII